MTSWTANELDRISSTDELDLASLQSDGTLGKPMTIWVVRVADDLFVRPVNGRSGAWFRSTQVQHAGRIESGGVEKDVTFGDADPGLNEQIDAVYRRKYHRYAASIVDPVLTPKSRAATLRLVPR